MILQTLSVIWNKLKALYNSSIDYSLLKFIS